MILSAEQLAIRQFFRGIVIEHWLYHKESRMHAILKAVAVRFDLDSDDAYSQMSAIPSIGAFPKGQPLMAWLAASYPEISNALFDGASEEVVMRLWKTVGRQPNRFSDFSKDDSRKRGTEKARRRK